MTFLEYVMETEGFWPLFREPSTDKAKLIALVSSKWHEGSRLVFVRTNQRGEITELALEVMKNSKGEKTLKKYGFSEVQIFPGGSEVADGFSGWVASDKESISISIVTPSGTVVVISISFSTIGLENISTNCFPSSSSSSSCIKFIMSIDKIAGGIPYVVIAQPFISTRPPKRPKPDFKPSHKPDMKPDFKPEHKPSDKPAEPSAQAQGEQSPQNISVVDATPIE